MKPERISLMGVRITLPFAALMLMWEGLYLFTGSKVEATILTILVTLSGAGLGTAAVVSGEASPRMITWIDIVAEPLHEYLNGITPSAEDQQYPLLHKILWLGVAIVVARWLGQTLQRPRIDKYFAVYQPLQQERRLARDGYGVQMHTAVTVRHTHRRPGSLLYLHFHITSYCFSILYYKMTNKTQ